MEKLICASNANGPAWFLLACCHLRAGRMKEAARAYGMAYHADCHVENAALLTFACLKASEGEKSNIVEQILHTWRELGCPNVMKAALDRYVMQCLESTERDVPRCSDLGRLIWLISGPVVQSSIETWLSDGNPQWMPLRKHPRPGEK